MSASTPVTADANATAAELQAAAAQERAAAQAAAAQAHGGIRQGILPGGTR
jgi:hypothetical protein